MTDVVIVNWNSGDYLKKCINSIFTNRKNEKLIGTVFIIDNNSSDPSLQSIPAYDNLVIIKNSENYGFSRACNQGFKLCTSAYVLLLNPDAQLLENTLQDSMNLMQNRNDVDILGCQLIDEQGKVTVSCARFPTPIGIFYDSTGLSKIAPAIFKPGILMTDFNHRESRFVDQVMGAYMFMRKTIFEKCGYFDTQFFVYFEELDYSKRLSAIGGRSYFDADIKAMHSGGGTTNSVKAFRLFLNLRSRLLYAKKHFSSTGYYCVWFCTFFIEPVTRTLFLLLKGNTREVKEIYKSYKLLLNPANAQARINK